MQTRQQFYTSDTWSKFRKVIIEQRTDEDGFVRCAICGQPILKKYDLIVHHKQELTDLNVNDASVALNPDNVECVHFKCHNQIHERFGFNKTSKGGIHQPVRLLEADIRDQLINRNDNPIDKWCLGMNDPDTFDAVNESWKTIYDKVIERQKEYGFELVLYTVPTTPTMNNRFKDAIVRGSGYRYIEADKAVRINDSGDWISGTLNSDNVHPTETGAKVIYNRILADLPEIMCNR